MNKAKIRFLRIGKWIEAKPWAFRGVALLSFLWLVILVPFLSLYQDGIRPFFSPVNKGNQDLAHYYMGGALILDRAFDSMYPDSVSNLTANVGWPENSVPKPGYSMVARERGVEDSFRYILPPPSALLFTPLALLPYPAARWVWVILLGTACWGLCYFSYHMSLRSGGSRSIGLLWWSIWAFSPLMLKALRTANSTPVAALVVAVAAAGIFRNRKLMAVSACIIAGLLKGTSLVFIPLIVFMRRWGIVVGGILAAAGINLMMASLAGTEVYREFFTVVYPSTRMPDPFIGNQSVFGFLYRLNGSAALTPQVIATVRGLGYLFSLALIIQIWRIRSLIDRDFPRFNSAVLGLLGLYLIFGSYCWDHYILFYLPFWTVMWNRCRRGLFRTALLLSAALVWLPFAVMRGVSWLSCEPLQSHMLWGQILLLITVAADIFSKSWTHAEGMKNGTGA